MIEMQKRDDLDGKTGGKHYLTSNAAIPCFESKRKVARNRIICVACGAKWNPSR